jgi:formylglycine-generating enzyme required for sulfatase activity
LVSAEGPTGAPGESGTTYRIAHEALLRRWEWIKGVLDRQLGHLNTAQLIERQAEVWDRAKRAKAWLDLREDSLREALAVAGRAGFKTRLAGLPTAYIDACRRKEAAATRKRRAGYSIMFALLAGIGAYGVIYSLWHGVVAYRLQNLSKNLTKPWVVFQDCSSCPQLVVISSGSFMMGSTESDIDARDGERPHHRVTIAKPFAMSRFEVTFAEWNACVDSGGCEHRPSDKGWGQANRPVINVSWDDITKQYLPWLSELTGQTYRLLTEAEWEFAARGGKTTRYSWGDDVGQDNANCYGCGSQWDHKQTAPVGSFKPNDFGLYDMLGNVWEWVHDCYVEKAYSTAPVDGSAISEKNNCSRVLRGGSWDTYPRNVRAANRSWGVPVYRGLDIGFRVARVLPARRTN